MGELTNIDYISEAEAGGSICWAELLPQQNDDYSLIITLCESGFTLISLTLDETFSSTTITNRQTIDLKAYLYSINIRLPTDASFRRSHTSIISDTEFNMVTLISNFNSVQWGFYLKNGVVISKIWIISILHRYGDFSTGQELSIDPAGRYLMITYYGLY